MRSRYSAFALGLADYLLTSWHPSTRPTTLDLTTPPQPKWLGLSISSSGLDDADHGWVAFVARCRIGGRAERIVERSRFVREGGRWLYLDGELS